jgi:hypothetical protein
MKQIDKLEKERETLKEKLKTVMNYEERRELQRQLILISSKLSQLKRL